MYVPLGEKIPETWHQNRVQTVFSYKCHRSFTIVWKL